MIEEHNLHAIFNDYIEYVKKSAKAGSDKHRRINNLYEKNDIGSINLASESYYFTGYWPAYAKKDAKKFADSWMKQNPGICPNSDSCQASG